MVKYILCFVIILLIIIDAIIFIGWKKYLKLHKNELVEKHIKGLLGRGIAMTIISFCVGAIAIVLQIV